MNTVVKVIIGIAAIAALLWSGYQYLPQNNTRDTNERVHSKNAADPAGATDTALPITIGFAGALTGDAAIWGVPIRNAVEMAVNDINAAGGVNGRSLKVLYENSKCTANGGVHAADNLVNAAGVRIIIGGVCSSETQAMLAVTEEKKVIVLSPSASSPNLTGAGDYFFRSSPSDAKGGSFLADLILEKYTTIATIAEETEYTLALEQVFEDTFAKNGGTILISKRFAPGTKDFTDKIAKMQALSPEAVVVNPQGDAGGIIVRQIREAGVTAPLYGTNVLSSAEVIQAAGEAIEGLTFFDNPDITLNSPKAVSFLERYKDTYDDPGVEFYTGAAYDAVHILTEAIKRVGSENTDAIRNYLRTMKDFDGVIGRHAFDENGDITGIVHVEKKIEGGEVLTIR